ncbi:hypothetical protein A2767_01860 [Candidatus Roizmanbacteria bacterium RIFCSPHIGHO2_01_FULL_35_10]|uniref:Uncharacterized protein n=1 Tax=Candidatus Roizmanbacteria bacterium RIFCSPLOWO2_01_FULL_35_13 TaxID=1802055 RepID=A0A1F7I7D5_9BACT|nr:MAG: hypothetical protein A2767_01860 [Candidatus Roizmanbacteria bacterium RIFCSPHIGHO2_01_FULL_35_10]OGK39278.1 MAG: hypothetical protein A3A74_00395 [Candidatus Roizmanbacteria bacterium RIFCSPLOWO2_01_FULL_35_13]
MNNINNNLQYKWSLASVILIIVGLLIGLNLILQRADNYLKIKAIDDCGRMTRFEQQNDDKSKVSYPVIDQYEDCIKKKGF